MNRSDNLVGLKEHHYWKTHSAGTGLGSYRDFEADAPDYSPMEFYSSDEDGDEDLSEWLASQ